MILTGASASAADEVRIALSVLTFEPVRTEHDRLMRRSRPLPAQAEPALHAENIVGLPGKPLPVNLSISGLRTDSHLILTFRGLPQAVSLSSGFQSSDTWFVSYKDAQSLTLTSKNDYEGEFELRIELIRGKNLKPLSRIIRVIISGQTAPIAASESDVSGESETPKSDGQIVTEQAETTAATASLSHEKESQLMAVAASMLEQKDIAAARVVYARLARLGSADAAYMLAQSYDPAYLAQFQITGLSPEPEMAKRWYQIAAGLGNSEAPARLSALEEAGR